MVLYVTTVVAALMTSLGAVSSPNQLSTQLRKEVVYTLRATNREIGRSWSPPTEKHYEQIEAAYARIGAKITARSIEFIALHERFARIRPSVILFWGEFRAKELGADFFLELLSSKDPLVKRVALDQLGRALKRKLYPGQESKISRQCRAYYSRLSREETYFLYYLIPILESSRDQESIEALKNIAMSENRAARIRSVGALLRINTALSRSAVREILSVLKNDVEEIERRNANLGGAGT